MARPPSLGDCSDSRNEVEGASESSSGSSLLWFFGLSMPCIGSRPREAAFISLETQEGQASTPEEQHVHRPPDKAIPTEITVHTSTPGGVQEKRCFSRDATVYDLRCAFREVKGKQYKLLSQDGRELDNDDALSAFLEDEECADLLITKVNVCHPISLDMLNEVELPKKDSFKCEVFPCGCLDVTMGLSKFGQTDYTVMSIEDPQPGFRSPGKLEPYRLGYDYYDSLERYDIGEGRHRYRMLQDRKAELEKEFKARLPEFRHVAPQIFTNPDRIHKLRCFMDKSEFPPNRYNLFRFLNVLFDILTDKAAMLL